MRYLRFSMLIGVPDEQAQGEEEASVVSTDLREIINGELDPADLPYGMVVSEIDFQGDQTQ